MAKPVASKQAADPVLAALAHAEPYIATADTFGADPEITAVDRNRMRAFDASIALALSAPATTLEGLAAQIAALRSVLDWRDFAGEPSCYSESDVSRAAEAVDSFLTSAATTLARMGAVPPKMLADFTMLPGDIERLRTIAAPIPPKTA